MILKSKIEILKVLSSVSVQQVSRYDQAFKSKDLKVTILEFGLRNVTSEQCQSLPIILTHYLECSKFKSSKSFPLSPYFH